MSVSQVWSLTHFYSDAFLLSKIVVKSEFDNKTQLRFTFTLVVFDCVLGRNTTDCNLVSPKGSRNVGWGPFQVGLSSWPKLSSSLSVANEFKSKVEFLNGIF